ncbi:GlsB/YeaQ/YmgE family stress response membrane protein [Lysobacter oculi]|uniref:GlsB/YeaQ/YmgE family stress response membrane protein n=1 Tax=Solilutibacter oculi TaxID=2698682 RepID=A0A344J6B2_9GAMM|nr:GlsB/YeaQ/YmgE family stress response membrane protein [Lysobacter oculi]AXA84572.1 GlsB/YeaQ/YmgE family stress response membrane protein [Lysobacter oculi]
MFEGFFGYLIGGLVIGVLARLIKPGADPMGWIMTILLGVIGAVVGGWAATTFALGTVLTWVVALAAAVILLFVYEAMRKKRPVAR